MKQIPFLKKKSDIETMEKILYVGQKSFLCKKCNVFGPWHLRFKHICKEVLQKHFMVKFPKKLELLHWKD